MMRMLSASIAVAALVAPSMSWSQALIRVRAGTGLNLNAQKILAEHAQPRILTIHAGESPDAAVKKICGDYDKHFEGILADANRGFSMTVANADRKLKVPACFIVFRRPIEVQVSGQESVADVADRVVGASGMQTINRLTSDNPNLAEGIAMDGVTEDEAKRNYRFGEDQSLVINYSTQAVIYALKPGVPGDKTIRALRRELHLEQAADEPNNARLVPAFASNADCKIARLPGAAWPFDAQLLGRVLAHEAAPKRIAIIGIVDSGLYDLPSSQFPQNVFTAPRDRDNQYYTNDAMGAVLWSRSGPPTPYDSFTDAEHGTYIASLTLGGPEFFAMYGSEKLAQRIKIRVVNVVDSRLSGGAIPLNNIADAVGYLSTSGADIINLSIQSSDALGSLPQELSRNHDILLVAAAGNDRTDFRQRSIFPAGYGGSLGDFRKIVLSVAAHDQKGAPAVFTGRGARGVDLAAPGCAIPSLGRGAAIHVADGTSLSTALASFASALLYSQGLSAAEIKQRLGQTVDWTPEFDDLTATGGNLNVVRAVSLSRDVLTTDHGVLRFGHVKLGPFGTRDLCQEMSAPDIGSVSKISVDKKANVLRYGYYVDGEHLTGKCTPRADVNIYFDEETADGSPVPHNIDEDETADCIKLSDIIDLSIGWSNS